MRLVGGKHLGEAVDGRRGRGDDPAHPLAQGGLDHVVGAVDHHLEPEARFLGALGDPQGRLVEDDVDPARQLGRPARDRGCRPRRPVRARWRAPRPGSRACRARSCRARRSPRAPACTSWSAMLEPTAPAPPVMSARSPRIVKDTHGRSTRPGSAIFRACPFNCRRSRTAGRRCKNAHGDGSELASRRENRR